MTMTRDTVHNPAGRPDPNAEREQRRMHRIADLYANDPQFRAAQPLPAVAEAVAEPGLRLAPLLRTIMEGYADRPALGQRAREAGTDPTTGSTVERLLPQFTTLTYGELWAQVSALAALWRQDSNHAVGPGDRVALVGFASADYLTIDLVCGYLGLVSVPLQHNAPVAQLASIVAEVEPTVVAVSAEYLDAGVEAVLASTSLRRLVVFDYHPAHNEHRRMLRAARARLAAAGLTPDSSGVLIEVLDEAVERGKNLPPAPLFTAGTDERTAMILYTSGSTGTPKGALYTERMAASLWALSQQSPTPVINVNFMPLNHLYGRSPLASAFLAGGTSYFVPESDLSTLFEDWALARPTELKLAPRVVEMLHQRYRASVDRHTADGEDAAEAEALAATELRERVLGGRVLAGLVSSAPLTAEMSAFLDDCLDVHVVDGYGLTEIGPVTEDHRVMRPPVTDYRLIDVPELGYFLTDRPYPRGELIVKTWRAMSGYYKRPELAAHVFDADGYYHTGDIMAETEPDRLVFVDRRSNVLKLAQGEFVAVARLEAVYAGAPLVRQVFIYGNGEQPGLLAVIVPTPDAMERYAGDPASLKSALAESLRRTARQAELQTYEIPLDFLVEHEPFSTARGLLSGVGKALYPRLKAHYGARLEELYREIAAARLDTRRALHLTAAEQPPLDTVTRAAGMLMGSGDVDPDGQFADLGGDSLTALSFSGLLQDLFGVEVPVALIISPSSCLRSLADHITARRQAGGAGRPTADTVHGAGASELRARDLTLDTFIDTATLTEAASLGVTGKQPPAPGNTPANAPAQAAVVPRTVLLTGATGWLGRFLLLEWLERLSPADGTLIAVVRGRDAVEARARLDRVFGSADPQLRSRFQALAAKHLEVVVGDIEAPGLGLDTATWNRLAELVDVIVHPAALVNHVLPYTELFGPNVAGTAEVIRLAITTRIKPVTYLSTAGVVRSIDPAAFDEDSDIREVSPVRKTDDTYANGYANSKWAGEVLMREAHDRCGLPVTVFRPDLLLAPAHYRGQLNLPDNLTRLILSILATRTAPVSFYAATATGERPRAHYDGLPVDFVAEAVTTMGGPGSGGFRSFDVMNPHDDDISLDTFVSWLTDAGYSIARIDDYADWLDRFETALRALPEKLRRQSSLPLLHAYRQPHDARASALAPTALFRAGVRAAGIGPGSDIPQVSEALITKYASDLELLGLLPEPDAAARRQ